MSRNLILRLKLIAVTLTFLILTLSYSGDRHLSVGVGAIISCARKPIQLNSSNPSEPSPQSRSGGSLRKYLTYIYMEVGSGRGTLLLWRTPHINYKGAPCIFLFPTTDSIILLRAELWDTSAFLLHGMQKTDGRAVSISHCFILFLWSFPQVQ